MAAGRRRAPRVRKYLSLDIRGFELFTSNISAGGMQFTCPSMQYGRIRDVVGAGRITATLRLPAGEAVEVAGRVAYVADAGDEYLVGVEFETFSGDGKQCWTAYLSSEPASD